jgi:hypothetical protein
MKYDVMKKNILFLIISLIASPIICQQFDDQNSELVNDQDAVSIIHAMEKSIERVDNNKFTKLLHHYISSFGQVYEKQTGMFEGYKQTYYISSNYDQSKLLTPVENIFLMQVLDRATQQNNWGASVIIKLSVLDLKTAISITKLLTLDEVRIAIKQLSSPVGYSRSVILSAAALGALSIAGGLYYFAQQNPELIEQAADTMKYGWQDFKDSIHQISKYFTDPQNYEQFEKQHDLLSEDMTINERLQRFREWQAGEQIQQNINNKMKEVTRFEEKLHLSSENMLDEDRIKILQEWKKQERAVRRLDKKMQPVKAFEKQHKLLLQDMTEQERLQRFQEWQKGDRQQKSMHEKMKPVQQFEKQHTLLSQGMTQQERLKRFKEWQKGDAQQKTLDEKIKQVQAWEKKEKVPSTNVYYEDRIKKYEAWQKAEEHKKIIEAVKKWESNHPYLAGDWEWEEVETSWGYDCKKVYKEKTEQERIDRYYRQANPIERYTLENGWIVD